ncbi:SpaH/EbpB family LPXTG-anchored major pilin [Microbacterium lacticum]
MSAYAVAHPRTGRALRRARAAAAALAALAVVLLALWGGAQPSRADQPAPSIDPAAATAIEIHKLRQPDGLLPPATGLVQDTAGLAPVAGAVFTATLVPGLDLTTDAGQRAAAQLTAGQAEVLISGVAPSARATTDNNGNASLSGLQVGMYLVREVGTPTGYTPSVPFLVPLPLTVPDTRAGWLYTVHVYPKNAYAGVALSVIDHDAVTLGDTVRWQSQSDIPHVPVLDGYRLVQRLDARLNLVGGADVSILCNVALAGGACPRPVEGVDYTMSYDGSARLLTVNFTPAGRAMLAHTAGLDPAARVVVSYRTAVLAGGELSSESILYASDAAIRGGSGAPAPVSDSAMTKWGPLAVVVHERGRPDHLISGAALRLYRTADDAAAGRNPIVVNGVSTWTTDAQGRVDIPGLRFSGFVDGLDRELSDPLYRYYYAVPISFPSGYTGSTAPLRTIVASTTDAQVVTVEVWRTGDGALPVTGGQIPWAIAATSLAAIGAGILFVLRRRERREDAPRS